MSFIWHMHLWEIEIFMVEKLGYIFGCLETLSYLCSVRPEKSGDLNVFTIKISTLVDVANCEDYGRELIPPFLLHVRHKDVNPRTDLLHGKPSVDFWMLGAGRILEFTKVH